MEQVMARLTAMREEPYAQFQRRLLPTLPPEKILGVRTPALRHLADDMLREGSAEAFLRACPHRYFEEDQLHAFILCRTRDFDACLAQVETFLPWVDNWATCDQMSPAAFRREPERLLPSIARWLASPHLYTVRFAVGMLMQHFLDARFDERYLRWVTDIRSDEYYVRMEIAWYLATALAKQWDATLPVLTGGGLDRWVHQKTIQKAVESRRIPQARKEYLITLRRK